MVVRGTSAVALAAAPLLHASLAWVWDLILHTTPRDAIVLLGYATFVIYNILPVFNTFLKAWTMKSVGGGTRGEPFVASLLSYACWLLFSWMDNGGKVNESVWLNGVGTGLYLIYVLLFLWYMNGTHGWITLEKWVIAAVLYLLVTALFGVLTEWTLFVKLMCTLAGLASACASLVLALFVLEKRRDFLPDFVSTTMSLVHYGMWIVRDLFQPRDYCDLVQNIFGFGCSLLFLFLPLFYTRDDTHAGPTQAGQNDLNRPLISQEEKGPPPPMSPPPPPPPPPPSLRRRVRSAPATPVKEDDHTRSVSL